MIDLDQFRERGFVRVPAAMDPELIRRWREDAVARLRSAEAKDLHDSLPPWTPELFADLDPARPRTWKARRATLRGTQRVALPEAAPQLISTLDELLGPGRLFTKTITDYMILSFGIRPRRRWLWRLRRTVQSHSYHLDDPGPAMTLSGWRNAFLLVVLYSDIAPGGGGTLLACDSPPKVAKALAAGPVDFVSPARARALAAECRDIEELTGDAGDVFILHPFMLHGAQPNGASTIRIIANPILRAKGELAFAPGTHARSPLEEITQSWVR